MYLKRPKTKCNLNDKRLNAVGVTMDYEMDEFTLLMIIVRSSKPKQMAYNGKWSPASFFSIILCRQKNIRE